MLIDYVPHKDYTNTNTQIQDFDVIIHTLFDEFISWYSRLGYLKFEPDDSMVGPARVYTVPHNIPDYQSGQTNWEVGMACVFDY